MEAIKWKYQVIPVDPERLRKRLGDGHIMEGMNAEGSMGWELLAVVREDSGWLQLFYKRPADAPK